MNRNALCDLFKSVPYFDLLHPSPASLSLTSFPFSTMQPRKNVLCQLLLDEERP
jgi:hypothetical protein